MASLTTEAPDPRTFQSWEDAFKYPVPVVRRMQQQLKGGISTNRERLRTLVGSSYRDLLGTAETIVHMDSLMQEVETNLGDTSRRCNSSRLEKSYRNSSRLSKESKADERKLFAEASQLYVLQRCPDIIARIIRKGGSLQLAAKVLVVSRLLHKKLDGSQRAPGYVTAAWSMLTKMRHGLRMIVERKLADTRLQSPELVEVMCAYLLVTGSSSVSDMLRHFHRIRLEALSSSAKRDESDQTHIVNALQLWIRTLQDTRAIFPKQLSNALAKLTSKPILKDAEVLSIWECDFEAHAPWLGEDVQNFIPYLRHDDLSVAAAAQQLSAWAPVALKSLLQTVAESMAASNDLAWIADLRLACLKALFSHYHVPGVRKDVVLKGFRDVFETKLLSMVHNDCESLSKVLAEVGSIVGNWDAHKGDYIDTRLWSKSMISMDASRGAKAFTDLLHSKLHGETGSVRNILGRYKSWLAGIEEIEKLIASMRTTKWSDYLDDIDEDSDEEDEDDELSLKNTQILLRETDPNMLDEELSRRLTQSFDSFCNAFGRLSNIVVADAQDAQQKSALLLRVLREVNQHLPKAVAAAGPLKLPFISSLHRALATPVVKGTVRRNSRAIAKSLRQKFPTGRALWDGSPELPVLPAPWAFQLVRDLQHELSKLGTDLWTPAALAEMKKLLRVELLARVSAVITARKNRERKTKEGNETLENGANGDNKNDTPDVPSSSSSPAEETEETEETESGSSSSHLSKDTAIQLLFDLTFLAATAAPQGTQPEPEPEPESDSDSDSDNKDQTVSDIDLASFVAEVERKASLSAELLGRVRASAEEYRKRTALLFALANS